jgi:coproporphyrinogen III oxidase
MLYSDQVPHKLDIQAAFMELQDSICAALEQADGTAKFKEDYWERLEGGGGRTRVLEQGAVIEKGGVAFSAVHGALHPKMLQSMGIDQETNFFATGVSLVIHPENPWVPIVHMNVRYFEMENGTCWFGGGIDLTPHYIDTKQAKWFHEQLKNVCDKHEIAHYESFKKEADHYFYSPHRKETRGIGGIFFDYQKPNETKSKKQIFDFVIDLGYSFAPIYTNLIVLNKDLTYTETNKQWQSLRRGRYVEFNLVHDRGTKFGLETNGRTESILMSMPPMAQWVYNFQPAPNSPEEATLKLLVKGIDWV